MSEVAMRILSLAESNSSHVYHVNLCGNTSLLTACMNRMTDVALYILSISRENIDQIGENSRTALMWACYNKMYEVAVDILSTPVIVHCTDKDGLTALTITCNAVPIYNPRNDVDQLELKDCSSNNLFTIIDVANLIISQMTDVMDDMDEHPLILSLCGNPSLNRLIVNLLQSPKYCNKLKASINNLALLKACENNMKDVALLVLEKTNALIGGTNKHSVIQQIIDTNMMDVIIAITQKQDMYKNIVETVETADHAECMICCGETDETVLFNPCMHSFAYHEKCFNRLIACPTCRKKIKSQQKIFPQ
jgi:hypothetical protein